MRVPHAEPSSRFREGGSLVSTPDCLMLDLAELARQLDARTDRVDELRRYL